MSVAVDGADLYCETRGEGPPVLIVQGGLSEAGATGQLADVLARHFQVISYDRRGLSRSSVPGDCPPITMDHHADDAAALLAAVTTRPAHVVGPSIGGLIGLHLAVRHPERVATLVTHEPPMAPLVVDPEREAALDRIAALARDDVRVAIQEMAALTGGDVETEPGAAPAPPAGDMDANLRWFFTHDFPAARQSTLDPSRIAELPASTTVVPTGGTASRGEWEYRCAQRLARELGRELIELPGGHNVLVSHPRTTATELRRLFTEASG